MRAARELHFDRVESFDALIDSATPALTTVIAAEPGWSSLAPPTMLFPASSEIQKSYCSQYQASDLVIGLVPDVAVSRGSLVWLGDQVALFREPLQPGYVSQYIENAWFPAATEDIAEKIRVDIDDPCVLVTHFNVGTYGHWLLEGLPKLFLLNHIQKLWPNFSIVLPNSAPAFIRKWVELVLPGIRIVTFNDKTEYALCRKLLIPGLCYAAGYHFHPIVNTWIDSLVEDVGRARQRPVIETLYITRTSPSNFRFMENQNEIEALAASRGSSCFRLRHIQSLSR